MKRGEDDRQKVAEEAVPLAMDFMSHLAEVYRWMQDETTTVPIPLNVRGHARDAVAASRAFMRWLRAQAEQGMLPPPAQPPLLVLTPEDKTRM